MMLEQLNIHMACTHTHIHTHKNLDTDLTPFTKINSKQTTHLNVKCKTIKLLESNTGENLDDFGHADDSLDIIPKARCMKEITDKLDFIKIKNCIKIEKTILRE